MFRLCPDHVEDGQRACGNLQGSTCCALSNHVVCEPALVATTDNMLGGIFDFDARLASCDVVGHDIYRALVDGKIETPDERGDIFDTKIAAMLLDGGGGGPVLEQVERRLSTKGSRTGSVAHVARALDAHLRKQDLVGTAELEFSIIPAIASMTMTGLPIDLAALQALQRERTRELVIEGALLGHVLGVDEPDDTAAVKTALSTALGVALPSTRREDLAVHALDPRVDMVIRYRTVQSLKNFGDDLLRRVDPDGRVRCRIDQLGCATGRLTASQPNLMAFPGDPALRRCVAAAPGYLLVCADYSCIDLRVIAEVTREPTLIELFRAGGDPHVLTAAMLLDKDVHDVTDGERAGAKPFNFGAVYGMGADGIVRYALKTYGLRIDVETAVAHRRRFFDTFPLIAAWHEKVRFERAGSVRTLGGRVRHFQGGDADFCARLATIGQGSTADGLKKAIALLQPILRTLGARLLLTVHDELVVEAPTAYAAVCADAVRWAMETGMSQLVPSVPIVVEPVVARTWAEAKNSTAVSSTRS
jgi:DNA polymerase-1